MEFSRRLFAAPLLAARTVLLVLSVVAVSPTALEAQTDGHELRGRLTLTNRSGTRPSRSAKPEDAVIFFQPRHDGGSAGDAAEERYEVSTVGKQFSPSLLVVQRGSEVFFPNRDPILHNVFSVSGNNRFDLDIYGKGEGRSHVFEHTGLVRVYCNVHREMFAHLWVVDTPYVVRPDAKGDFALEGLPTLDGTLTYWHPRADVQTLPLEAKALVDLQLKVTKPRLPLHKNKFGRPYRRTTDYGG